MERREVSTNPLKYVCSAIKNIVASANGNEKLSLWERLSLDQLVECFSGVKKDKFLTEKPLAKTLQLFQSIPGDLRDCVPNGARMTLVVNGCDDNGLELAPIYFNDEANTVFPYFKILYSNPRDPRGNAMGLANVKPAPLLQIYPEEILLQCSFIVDYSLAASTANNRRATTAAQSSFGDDDDDQNAQDYLYLAGEITDKYARLQELIRGRMK
jgi:hypothetical protein